VCFKFDISVHLRRFGGGVPTPDAVLLKEAGEVGFELAAVVGLHLAHPGMSRGELGFAQVGRACAGGVLLTRRGSVLGVLCLLGAEDLAARAAGLPPWALSAAFKR
jgi:hypothetical protein